MNIILTSSGLIYEEVITKVKNMILKPFCDLKMLVIPTARKEEYNKDKYIQDYINLGFRKSNIIMFDDENSNKYCNLDIDIIYVCGGNTFLLQKYLLETKFDIEIKKYIEKGVIYLGASAGTHIAASNIEHVLNFDDNIVNINNFKGLNLINGIIICHYDDSRKEVFNKIRSNSKYPVYSLNDKEVIHFSGNSIDKK